MLELTLAVVGIDYANADRSNRRMELLFAKPGDPIDLRLEPRNKHDRNAVAVFSSRGIQVGYLTAERAPFIGSRIRNGEPWSAIFQGLDTGAAYIRIRFGGGVPTLPIGQADHFADAGNMIAAARDDEFYPDPDGPEFGA